MFDGGQAGADSGGDIAGKGIDSTSKVSFYGCILGFFPFLVWPAIVARALLTHCAAAKKWSVNNQRVTHICKHLAHLKQVWGFTGILFFFSL